jgi:hypothetical protein
MQSCSDAARNLPEKLPLHRSAAAAFFGSISIPENFSIDIDISGMFQSDSP